MNNSIIHTRGLKFLGNFSTDQLEILYKEAIGYYFGAI